MSVHVSGMKKASRLYFSYLVLPCIALAMTCCSSREPSAQPEQDKSSPSFFGVVTDTVKGSVKGAFQAVQTPFEDIGLKRQAIPEPLKKLPTNPYAMPLPLNCSTVSGEINGLNTVLGPDLIVASKDGYDNSSLSSAWKSAQNITWDNKDKYVQQSSNMVQQRAADEVKSHVSIIPYRNWLRWISGADAHAKKVAEAYEGGRIRRAFLRGIEVNLHCAGGVLAEATPAKPAKIAKVKPKVRDMDEDESAAEETALNDVKEEQ